MTKRSTFNELRKIRRELSKEMVNMSPEQRREYAQVAEAVYRGMKEHKEGKTKRFSDVKKLIEYLDK